MALLGAVDLARAQVTDQQLVAAKDIQWQKAIVVVITMKEPAFLFAMNDIVSGIKVQNQFLRRFFERGNELLDDFVHAPGGLAVDPVPPA